MAEFAIAAATALASAGAGYAAQKLTAGGASKAAAEQRDLARIAQQKQAQTAQDQAAETAAGFSASKSVRGSRLLLSDKSGGLATTLGGA